MLLKSGSNQDQSNHTYSYAHDPDAAGLDAKKIQDAILKFYDKPLDVWVCPANEHDPGHTNSCILGSGFAGDSSSSGREDIAATFHHCLCKPVHLKVWVCVC